MTEAEKIAEQERLKEKFRQKRAKKVVKELPSK